MKTLFIGFSLILLLVLGSMLGLVYLIAGDQKSSSGDFGDSGESIQGDLQVSSRVERYRPLFETYAEMNGLAKYVDLIMALVMQESGGRSLDIMQASESIGFPPDTITDPEYSIKVGMKHFKSILTKAGGDTKLTLQAYNYGSAFIDYVKAHGGKYTKDLAVNYSHMMAKKVGWPSYGDPHYVEHVMRYYHNGAIVVGYESSGKQKFDVQQVEPIMKHYLGMPYVWGGPSPSAGGFDYSGILEYAFGQVGINLKGNAKAQYNKTMPVKESDIIPGDLVFFSTYAEGPTHVGMYVGDGEFINANDNGLGYSSVAKWKTLYEFLGFRRI